MAHQLQRRPDHAPKRPRSLDSKATTFKRLDKSTFSDREWRNFDGRTPRGPIPHRHSDGKWPRSLGSGRSKDHIGEWGYPPESGRPISDSNSRLQKPFQPKSDHRAMERVKDLADLNLNRSSFSDKADDVETQTNTLLNDEQAGLGLHSHVENANLRSDTEISKADSAPSFSKPAKGARLDVGWEMVERLRAHVQSLRIVVQERRRHLEELQREKVEADERYIELIRTGHVSVFSKGQTDLSWRDELEKRWRACQKARDNYGPADNDLVALEDNLNADESKLTFLERRFYQARPNIPSQLIPTKNSENKNSQSMSTAEILLPDESGSGSSRTEEYPPLYEEYLGRLGDLDILEEQYGELLVQRATLVEERRLREGVGMTLQLEDLKFLDSFSSLEAEKLEEIRLTRSDVEQLKKACVLEGLTDAEGNPIYR